MAPRGLLRTCTTILVECKTGRFPRVCSSFDLTDPPYELHMRKKQAASAIRPLLHKLLRGCPFVLGPTANIYSGWDGVILT